VAIQKDRRALKEQIYVNVGLKYGEKREGSKGERGEKGGKKEGGAGGLEEMKGN